MINKLYNWKHMNKSIIINEKQKDSRRIYLLFDSNKE